MSVRSKACNQVTVRFKGGSLESPPTKKLHMSTPGERNAFPKLMGLETCNLPVLNFYAKHSNRKDSPDSGGKPGTVALGKAELQESCRLPKRKRTRMTTFTYNARTHASDAAIRWAWESPDGGCRNEINYIIVSKRFCLTDVAGVPKFYTGSDHRLHRGRFSFTRRGEKAAKFTEQTPRTILDWELFASLVGFWEGTVMDNIDDEYERLVEHLNIICTRKAKSFKSTKRRLSPKTLELIRLRGAAGNRELMSDLAILCREAIKEDLRKRRAEVLAEAAEAGQSIHYARRNFANRKTTTMLSGPQIEQLQHREGA
ncbi:hypothetical protein RB195_007668 [Necator americanus]|uniref:Uncharacterized protein n=1 Tax=Necator americanus TaxID=51031 RepID=A0ABR1BYB8_NECAM